MKIASVFLQRYDPLYDNYLAGYWEHVTADQMRLRPHPRLNSIAWNIWHLTRVEDAGLNRFVTDGSQVLDEGRWMERMKIPWRHNGTEMTFSEVDDLSQRADLSALRAYSDAVQHRTRSIIRDLGEDLLDEKLGEVRLRQIMADEGLAHANAEGFVRNYLGWSKAKCLFSFGLTHSYLHIGEMEVIASLVGVDFA